MKRIAPIIFCLSLFLVVGQVYGQGNSGNNGNGGGTSGNNGNGGGTSGNNGNGGGTSGNNGNGSGSGVDGNQGNGQGNAPSGPTESEFQSNARPAGLDIVGPTMEAGSDAASAAFQVGELPNFLNYVNANWGFAGALDGLNVVALDPSNLVIRQETEARSYFLSEGSNLNNTFGFNTEEILTGATPNKQLIFPDVASSNSYFSDPGGLSSNPRTAGESLLPGDFVDMGIVSAGEVLNFFLIGDGAGSGANFYYGNASDNPDGVSHMVVYAIPDSPFLLIGFEDTFGGGDADFNDNLFAINIGTANVNALANPEPSFWLMMGAVCGIGFWLYRRQDSGLFSA